ncbi:MAG: ABC transporter substrate-binding protein [Spirochaetaceae bacterium]|jgi:putative ABC transport system substrate-binding protein|nr:ABC transporter substrate-binding protein [Spirochaetaceae bacterium]
MKIFGKTLALCCAGFVVCGGAAMAGGKKDSALIKIGVIQLVEHVALDASYQGFVDGLKEAGYVEGQNVTFDFQNAQGEQANCVTIAQKLVNDKSDLILAIATPAAQAVANLTATIPIVITAVTDPQSAKLVKSNEMPGTNVTGTSDLTPVEAQIKLLKQIVPGAKTVGLLYNSSEQNSLFQIDLAKKACASLGLSYIDATASNANEIQQVVQSLVGKVDAVYSPTDNLIASAVPTVAAVTTAAKLPFICGEEGMTKAGGLATYGINYYNLGKQTAVMAVDILKNGKKPADMPIQYLEGGDLFINDEIARAIGITIPADLR